ncbi:CASP-like protein 4D1 [Cynara cardunculus var. scolymus]|uniref:CASP-like protein 4D1 n=1 Tax=Cynara cardunculus var. scolymus TaxID=59895 RepID=UPI000D62AA16|nr:CASP-like protein 4D1 [Cynara cardunculus var. scolymus]
MSDLKYEDPKPEKLPIVVLATRLTTLVALAVSIGLLRSISVTYNVGPFSNTFSYDDVSTYQYVFFGMVAGFSYTILQVPFALYFFFRKERIKNGALLVFEFYGDKICLTLLATVVGSLYGATVEKMEHVDEIKGFEGGYDAKDYHLKMTTFFMMVHISAAFLLVGFLCSVVSSIVSSRSLAKKS